MAEKNFDKLLNKSSFDDTFYEVPMFINYNLKRSHHQLNLLEVLSSLKDIEKVPKRKIVEQNMQSMKKRKQLQSLHFNINSIQSMKVCNHKYKDKVFIKPYEHI